MLRFIYRSFFTVVGKILQELAIVAALLSLAEVGTHVDRILGATFAILRTLQTFGADFYHNVPFPTAMGELKAGIDAALDGMAQSLTQDPQSALVALVLTYAVYKIAAFFCRLARAAAPKRRKRPLTPKIDEEQTTFEQLYRDPKAAR